MTKQEQFFDFVEHNQGGEPGRPREGCQSPETGPYDAAFICEASVRGKPKMLGTRRYRPISVKGLALDYDPRTFPNMKFNTHKAGRPIAGRSPQRGTVVGRDKILGGRHKIALMLPHMVNRQSDRDPYALHRQVEHLWTQHSDLNEVLAKHLTETDHLVVFSGDVNAHGTYVPKPLTRLGITEHHDDAFGFWAPPGLRVEVVKADWTDPRGSDHPALHVRLLVSSS